MRLVLGTLKSAEYQHPDPDRELFIKLVGERRSKSFPFSRMSATTAHDANPAAKRDLDTSYLPFASSLARNATPEMIKQARINVHVGLRRSSYALAIEAVLLAGGSLWLPTLTTSSDTGAKLSQSAVVSLRIGAGLFTALAIALYRTYPNHLAYPPHSATRRLQVIHASGAPPRR